MPTAVLTAETSRTYHINVMAVDIDDLSLVEQATIAAGSWKPNLSVGLLLVILVSATKSMILAHHC